MVEHRTCNAAAGGSNPPRGYVSCQPFYAILSHVSQFKSARGLTSFCIRLYHLTHVSAHFWRWCKVKLSRATIEPLSLSLSQVCRGILLTRHKDNTYIFFVNVPDAYVSTLDPKTPHFPFTRGNITFRWSGSPYTRKGACSPKLSVTPLRRDHHDPSSLEWHN